MALIGGEGLWCGASLRPWQILHSRLARMHTCGLLECDVWELMDETVEAAIYPLREELHFLDGDDGELWRQGGVMEARIRDWITSRIEEEEEEEKEEAPPYSATYSSEFSETWYSAYMEEIIAGDGAYVESYAEEEIKEDGSYNGGGVNTVATYSSEFSETWDSSSTLEEAIAAGVYDEDEEEEDDNHGSYIGVSAANLAAPLDADTHYYQFSDDLQAGHAAAREEDDEQICAVCLEKLEYMNEDQQLQGGYTMNNYITRLPCRHSFHSHCLSPWLSASSFCPCCRAPIFPLHLEAPPNLELSLLSAANCSDGVQLDMMGLLAEMEAALDRFGLLS